MIKKFEKVFEKTEEKMGNNEYIDFKKSDVNDKPKTLHRTNKVQTHLSDNEFKAFVDTLKPLENRSERVRALIIKDIKSRQKKAEDNKRISES